MNKLIFQKFIDKYSLSGLVESAKWVANEHGLSTDFTTENKNLIGHVSTGKITLDPGEYKIGETNGLKNMLAVMADELNLTVEQKNGRPVAIHMKDESIKAKFVLADTEATVPIIKNLPTANVVVSLDQRFVMLFTKAKAALPSVERFTILSDGTTAQIIVGYEAETNVSSIAIAVTALTNSELKPIHFDADALKAILLNNKEMRGATLFASERGLMWVVVDVDDFTVRYYISQRNK